MHSQFPNFRIILFIPVFLIFQCNLFGQADKLHPQSFNNIGLEGGLSNLSVSSFCEDNLGFIWVGTARGIDRFDGNSFEHFFFNDKDTNSLYNDFITSLAVKDKQLFIGTNNGLNKYDIEKEKMQRVGSNKTSYASLTVWGNVIYGAPAFSGLEYYNSQKNSMIRLEKIPKDILINQLIADKDNGIWCLPDNQNYLFLYNPELNKLTKYELNFEQNKPGSKRLNCGKIIGNNLWVGSNNGIQIFDIDRRKFLSASELPAAIHTLLNIEITSIEINKGVVWIGSKTDGLFIYDTKSGQIQQYNKDNINNISSSFIRTIFVDRSNNVWVGTFESGIDVSFEQRKNFNFDNVLNKYIAKKFVNCIVSDNKDLLYLGTRNYGLVIYNKKTRKIENLTRQSGSFSCNHVQAMFLDSQNKLWIGTEENLYILNTVSRKISLVHLPFNMSNDQSYLQYSVGYNVFAETSDGIILAGTGSNGIIKFGLNGTYQAHIKKMGNNINQIIPVGNGNFIVNAYGKGVYEYKSATDFVISLTDKSKAESNKTSEATTIFKDEFGTVWIGCFRYGLFSYDLRNKTVMNYTVKDGLPSNDVIGITEDQNHRLWLSTSYGLSNFDKKSKFINYYLNEGTGNQQYHQRATFREANGTIYFGGNNGLTYFNPKSLGDEPAQSPKIVLKSLNISNQKVYPGDDTELLETNLAYTRKIRLNHKYPVFSIDFVGFDYIASNKLKYAYILEGFNKDWVYEQNRTRASFSNLAPGTYTFKVKAQNNNGIWSEQPAILTIEIVAAPWATWWAFLLYLIAVSAALLFVFRITLRSKLYKKELEIEHNEHSREKEINEMKIRFFTNISHEIRTPLTLIYGIAEKLPTVPLAELKNSPVLTRLKYNTERLLKMVNQLLMFKNLESDTLNLYIEDTDIVSLTRLYVEPFIFLAESKNIGIEFIFLVEDLIIPLDRDKYEKILSNLLGNALKFTNYQGVIKVIVDRKSQEKVITEYNTINTSLQGREIDYIEVKVKDNGIGIPEHELPEIFDRYKRVEGNISTGPDYSGSGIGLNFTKRLVELHKGAIKAESSEGKGSTFSFVIPISSEIYESKDWVKESGNVESIVFPEQEYLKEERIVESSVKVMIVEDDTELNSFIRESLGEFYKVVCAFNGAEGLALAKSQLPDLIVADITMPLVDGITMCQNVKEDAMLSHIPVILLTAKSDIEDQVSGYKHGADAYVIKPFNLKLLKSQIDGLIKVRRKLQKTFQNGLAPNLQKTNLNQIDINFLQKMEIVIKDKYVHSNFYIEELAQVMNMSRSSFYRKFVSLTKITPNDYLRKYRVNKSIDLMNQGVRNLGEISDLCGFSTPGNYSVAFKKEKGISPKQYQLSQGQ
jgi:signal transduction histidine kinase/ligand-binding sensor domain-containing protein/DNA-binding response OmpR family regulator